MNVDDNKINSITTRITNLENRIKELTKLINQLPDEKSNQNITTIDENITVIGEDKDDFEIEDDIIYGLSDKLIKQLQTLNNSNNPFTGKIIINFRGCGTIKRICWDAFYDKNYLYYVSEINLSYLRFLEEIGSRAFYKVGYLQENFTNIDLRCLTKLVTIKQGAFYCVGANSKTFESIKFYNNRSLVEIGAKAFAGIASKQSVDKSFMTEIFEVTFPNLKYIDKYAFANYKGNYTYKKYLFSLDCEKLQNIGSNAFIKHNNYGNIIPHIIIKCPSSCGISDNIFGPLEVYQLEKQLIRFECEVLE